jgi:hypothetical protein
MQINEQAAARLFSGQLQLKMYVQQKAGSGGGAGSGGAAKGRARTAGKPAGAAEPAGSGYHQHQQQQAPPPQLQQQRQQPYQQQQHQLRQLQQQEEVEDPIDLCDDDFEGEEASQRAALIKAALHQLNAALRLVRGTTRGPFSTAVQARVSCRHSHCRYPALLGRKGGWAGGELHASGCLPLL